MSAWWIDGIKNDEELAAALRQEANQTPHIGLSDLLEYAAQRIEALSSSSQPDRS